MKKFTFKDVMIVKKRSRTRISATVFQELYYKINKVYKYLHYFESRMNSSFGTNLSVKSAFTFTL